MGSLKYTKDVIAKSPFTDHLGMKVHEISEGRVETFLLIKPEHRMHFDFVHAGVLATLADHTCGMACSTVLSDPQKTRILTAEFKINLLRPASSTGEIRCIATVIKSGKQLVVCEADVFSCQNQENPVRVAKMIMTGAVVHHSPSPKL